MGPETEKPVWHMLEISVSGGLQGQPASPMSPTLNWLAPADTGLALLAVSAVAEQPRNFRRHTGTRLAVEVALRGLQDFLDRHPPTSDLLALTEAASAWLPQLLEQRWREAIATALMYAPLTMTELQTLEWHEGMAARQAVEANPGLAYDATLLVVLVTPTAIVSVRRGEGALLTVSETGQVTRLLPRPAEEEREPYTPGQADWWQGLRVVVQALTTPPPALLLLMTAGTERGLQDEARLLEVSADCFWRLRTDGLEGAQATLETWLTGVLPVDSRETMTVGGLYHVAVVPPPAPLVLPSTVDSGLTDDEGDTASSAVTATPISPESAPALEASEPPAEPVLRPRLWRGVLVTAQCRRTKQYFTVHIAERGHGRWIVSGASTVPNDAGPHMNDGQVTLTGDLGFDAAYPRCPYCQAAQVCQCGCGKIACWDGTRRAITCPWCCVIGEGYSQIEELRARRE